MSVPLLDISGLAVSLPSARGPVRILREVSLRIGQRRVVGLVGESGSGKSTLALALLGLLPEGALATATRVRFDGVSLSSVAVLGQRRGRELAMVFQEPMTALNPMFSVGRQLIDIQRQKFPQAPGKHLAARAEDMLARVGVPDARARMKQHPHQFSGGMRQRVLIAMALLVEPKLLIADEPTTALDATIELQIVELLRDLRRDLAGSILIVSHSLGLIAELCDEVAVLYAGQVVESGPVEAVLTQPRHPYTRALLACEIDPFQPFDRAAPLTTIAGTVPDPSEIGPGCAFAVRCGLAHAACLSPPPLRDHGGGHSAACWLEAAP